MFCECCIVHATSKIFLKIFSICCRTRIENNAKPNKSMDVRARTATLLSRCLLNFSLRVAGFAPRQFNRSVLSGVNPKRFEMRDKIFIACF